MKALMGDSAMPTDPIGTPLADIPFWNDEEGRLFEGFVRRERSASAAEETTSREDDSEAELLGRVSPTVVVRLVGHDRAPVVLEMRRLAASTSSTLLLLGTPLDSNLGCFLHRPDDGATPDDGEHAESVGSSSESASNGLLEIRQLLPVR